ncbi:MAG: dockerin type I domain-containing protein, partial [Anaerolineae bacterium]|nr:dockerin type I domain-containing protein [Anaerolineae bacterium]
DGFYSANTDPLAAIDEATYGDEYREDYYAWEWGDALFVVIDPFQYTMDLPYSPVAGEGNDDSVTGDQWSWTLGAQQFNWLKETLENSNAKYKFMFSHQMVGGIPRNASGGAGYVRGGAEAAGYFEWGDAAGFDGDGVNDHRDPAVFGTTPIHQLMVENGASAYFHGHDHQYVYETRDGIVYQEVPSPSMSGSGFSGIYTVGTYADYETIAMCPNSGHLRITITPDLATVDYVKSGGTGTCNPSDFSLSYTVEPNIVGPTYVLTTAVDPAAGGTISPAVGPHTYAQGQVVPVTATPNLGYIFSNWSGACTGSGACSVTMDADKTVTANFTEVPTYVLTTAVNPSGGGTINPTAGTHTYNTGEVVAVTATAATGYTFTSWSGACTGPGTCSVTMDANKTVIANFTQITHSLTVAVSPSGTGTTTPAVGVHPYAYGTVVNVTATPLTGYAFSSWSGACSGAGACSVTMDADKSVTANFITVSGNVASAATPSDTAPTAGEEVVVTINIDMSGVAAPNSALGSFTGSLAWDPAVLAYNSYSGPLAGFTGAVNTADVGIGQISFNGANATGATGDVEVFEFTFHAVGAGTSTLNLEYSAMAAATTFTNLLPLLTITDGQVVVSPGTLGDVNGDSMVDSTDALIVLSADAGVDTSSFCPMNCGDVNGDGYVNSTDALIILSYDAGMSVSYPVGTGACPSSLDEEPPGCTL